MTKSEIAKKLKALKSALIFCHANPDGDTLSSAFSLKYALNKLNIRAEVICADSIPDKYGVCDYLEELYNGNDDFEAHIAVDCANQDMIGKLYERFTRKRETYSIDHHISNSNYAKYNYFSSECANAVNIYEIIVEMGVEIDLKIAKTLYLGIVTDGGNFSQSNADSKAFLVAGELVKIGVSPSAIYNSMYKNQSISRAKLYARVMSNIKFFHNDQLAVITVSKKDIDEFDLAANVTEGFIDFPLSIGCVSVAVSIFEKDYEKYKISFRSKNDINVNEIASNFGGGGHIRASGAMILGPFEEVLDKLITTIGRYL